LPLVHIAERLQIGGRLGQSERLVQNLGEGLKAKPRDSKVSASQNKRLREAAPLRAIVFFGQRNQNVWCVLFRLSCGKRPVIWPLSMFFRATIFIL